MNRCWFAHRIVEVRRKYGLTVDHRETDALERVLSSCSSTELVVHDCGADAPASIDLPASSSVAPSGDVDALRISEYHGGMCTSSEPNIDPALPLKVGRTGLASFLLALLRPRDAKTATVEADVLTLRYRSGPGRSPSKKSNRPAWHEHGSGAARRSATPSGERPYRDYRGIRRGRSSMPLEAARLGWWRRTLAAHIETIRSVHDRLVQLADPPRYMARSVFSDLKCDAEKAVSEFAARWPDALSGTPEIRMLKTIQDFLKNSEGHRARANNAFVVNEQARSSEFFGRIEARPLTDEQRRAVVVDEDRNLVVAAAGSGKTSVIVAKAGWLLRKGYRRPSELLLLAFAKDAQMEMEERVRNRLGDEAAAGLTVRTFHSLGMSIIGAAEGKRPALAKVAEDDKALFDLLKGIIADLGVRTVLRPRR